MIEYLDKIVSQLETNSKFEKSPMILNGVISCKISPLDKSGIGYENKKKIEKEEYEPNYQRRKLKKRLRVMQMSLETLMKENTISKKEFMINKTQTSMSMKRLHDQEDHFLLGKNLFFLGYCYSCNNFGHKIVDYETYERNDQEKCIHVYMPPYNVGCYKCHKY